MSKTKTTASLESILSFPFQGADWQSRFGIGIALTLANMVIPFVPAIFVAGYVLRVMRQAVRGEEPGLPPWDDWGEMALDGLRVWVINLAYLAPGLVVMLGGMVLYFTVSFGFPVMIMYMEEGGQVSPLAPLLMIFGSMAIMFLSMAVGWVLSAVGGIPLPMAKAHFAARGEVSAAFRAREWWPLLRGNKLGYFIAWVVIAGLFVIWYCALMLAYYTIILIWLVPLLGLPFGFYLSLVSAALFGRVYRESGGVVTEDVSASKIPPTAVAGL